MKTTTNKKTEIINTIYQELKNRKINPSGKFDKGGRFYLDNNDLVNVRTPSRAYPYSEMLAGRTKKYVKAVCEKYNCSTIEELRAKV